MADKFINIVVNSVSLILTELSLARSKYRILEIKIENEAHRMRYYLRYLLGLFLELEYNRGNSEVYALNVILLIKSVIYISVVRSL